MSRNELTTRLANTIAELSRRHLKTTDHCFRVGIDGIDAAGKSTLAGELAQQLSSQGESIIRASVDGFHNPKQIRYRQGALSSAGYFYDSFNYQALEAKLLIPLGPGGNRLVQTAAYDYRHDGPVNPAPIQTPPRAILLFDGVFLQRAELTRHWDFVIFVDITFKECLARGLERNQNGRDSAASIKKQYRQRYIPGQQLYLSSCRPKEFADVVIDNNDLAEPRVISMSAGHRDILKANGPG